MYKKILLPTIVFFMTICFFAKAQNSSYNLNSIPIAGTNNAAFGFQSLFSNTSGQSNSAFGFQSLYSNTTFSNNTAMGFKSLYTNRSANNTAVGCSTLINNNTGSGNTAIGSSAMTTNAFGTNNTAIGLSALGSNYTGIANTAIGSTALFTNLSGSSNTGIGAGADVSANNLQNATAIGSNAIVTASNTIQLGDLNVTQIYAGTGTTAKVIAGGLQITGGSLAVGKILTSDASGNATWQTPAGGGGGWGLTGNAGTIDGTNFIGTTDNVPFNIRVNNLKAGRIDLALTSTFYGLEAGKDNTVGTENTGYGHHALRSNIYGLGNLALGVKSLYSNVGNPTFTDGCLNTAIGNYTLYFNTVGTANTALGASALYNNTTGLRNTGVGSNALLGTTTGSDNTGVGNNALQFNVTGSNNSGLGQFADVSTNSLSNSTAIGSFSVVNASNKIRFGRPTVTVVEGPVAYTISDKRFKKNVTEDVKGLDFINRLRPVVYNFDTKKFQEFLTKNMPDSIRKKYFDVDFNPSTAIRQSGFIAQEVEIAAKETGYDFNGVHIPENADDNYSLSYSQFVVPLVKSVQELSKQNEELKKELAELRSLIMEKKNNDGFITISESGAKLYQNAPNPFTQSTTIKYSLPVTARKAVIVITSSMGVIVKEYQLASKAEMVNILGGQLPAGTYTYSLFVDDKLIDTKKMILTQ